MADRLRVLIDGWVQGVGFRYSVCRQAKALSLNGWVRNLQDGRVEAEFEGSKEALEKMLAWCQKGPAFAKVTRVDAVWDSGPPQYADFRISG